AAEPLTHSRTVGAHWHSVSSRTYEAFMYMQRGEFSRAIDLAEHARQVMLLHDQTPSSFGDLEGFALFLAHWARGTTHSAQHMLHKFLTSRPDIAAAREHTRVSELSMVLFAIQEGRWTDASELARP